MSRVRAFSGHGFLGLGPVLNPSVASYPRSFSPQLPRLGSVPGTTIPKSASMSLSLPVPASDQPSSAATDTTNSSRRVRGRFPCAYCTKVFKRGEHRTRHERSHTHEKPFACSYCHKKYARKQVALATWLRILVYVYADLARPFVGISSHAMKGPCIGTDNNKTTQPEGLRNIRTITPYQNMDRPSNPSRMGIKIHRSGGNFASMQARQSSRPS